MISEKIEMFPVRHRLIQIFSSQENAAVAET